jgi:NAD(P)-dependent dehydrogenase (short-subunit alcohol dehydrogenase family)
MNGLERFDLHGKTALVTGGGSGLGRAISIGLAQSGAVVVLVDKNLETAEETLAEIERQGGSGLAVQADVTKSDEVRSALASAVAAFHKVDILVNCAGLTRRMPAEDFVESDWDLVIDVNLKGTFLCCRDVGKHMLENGGGSIINITSLGAHVAIVNSAAYCASKGGVAQLTKTLGVEWAARGVRVNAISPGVFETPLLRQCIEGDAAYGDRMLAKIPRGTFGKPEELVAPVVFLASDASSCVMAHILVVDGGYLAQ